MASTLDNELAVCEGKDSAAEGPLTSEWVISVLPGAPEARPSAGSASAPPGGTGFAAADRRLDWIPEVGYSRARWLFTAAASPRGVGFSNIASGGKSTS
jgi:hypothetical protein